MKTITAKVNNNGLFIPIAQLLSNGINIGREVEVKEANNSKQYKSFLKLLGLWELLLKTLEIDTGYSSEWWKFELKMRAGFGQVVDGPKDTKRFIPQSMRWEDSTIDQRSKLFSDSFKYISENGIIDLTLFCIRYNEITGKNIVY